MADEKAKAPAKADKKDEPSVEERLAKLEAAVGLGAPEEAAADAVPGEPLKQHELYSPPEEEEVGGAVYSEEDQKALAAAAK